MWKVRYPNSLATLFVEMNPDYQSVVHISFTSNCQMLLNKCTLRNEKTGLRISGQRVSRQDYMYNNWKFLIYITGLFTLNVFKWTS